MKDKPFHVKAEEYTISKFDLEPVRNSGRGRQKGDAKKTSSDNYRWRYDTKTTEKKSYSLKRDAFTNMKKEGVNADVDFPLLHVIFRENEYVMEEFIVMPVSCFEHLLSKKD